MLRLFKPYSYGLSPGLLYSPYLSWLLTMSSPREGWKMLNLCTRKKKLLGFSIPFSASWSLVRTLLRSFPQILGLCSCVCCQGVIFTVSEGSERKINNSLAVRLICWNPLAHKGYRCFPAKIFAFQLHPSFPNTKLLLVSLDFTRGFCLNSQC